MSKAFEMVRLLNGDYRQDYIKRRLNEGATTGAIVKEINHVDLYSGAEGKDWPAGVVYAVKRAMEAKVKPGTAPVVEKVIVPIFADDAPDEPSTEVVPDAFEGILNPEDIADIKLEAAKNYRSAERKKARKTLLATYEQDLAREAAAAAQRGQARGDMVDVEINLAPYAPGITLDGVFYRANSFVRVRRDVAKVLQEQCSRSWLHQASISGKEEQFARSQVAINGRVHTRDPRTGGLVV